MPRRVLILGAGLAGSRCAQTLRAEGFDGEITLVGDGAPSSLRAARALQGVPCRHPQRARPPAPGLLGGQ